MRPGTLTPICALHKGVTYNRPLFDTHTRSAQGRNAIILFVFWVRSNAFSNLVLTHRLCHTSATFWDSDLWSLNDVYCVKILRVRPRLATTTWRAPATSPYYISTTSPLHHQLHLQLHQLHLQLHLLTTSSNYISNYINYIATTSRLHHSLHLPTASSNYTFQLHLLLHHQLHLQLLNYIPNYIPQLHHLAASPTTSTTSPTTCSDVRRC